MQGILKGTIERALKRTSVGRLLRSINRCRTRIAAMAARLETGGAITSNALHANT
jgi:hypothetical protein